MDLNGREDGWLCVLFLCGISIITPFRMPIYIDSYLEMCLHLNDMDDEYGFPFVKQDANVKVLHTNDMGEKRERQKLMMMMKKK